MGLPARLHRRTRGGRSSNATYQQAVTPSQVQAAAEPYWKLAIYSGVLSAVYPLAAETVTALKEWTFLVVMLGTFGGLLFGVFSFVAKERMRYVSLVGMALALIAPLFY